MNERQRWLAILAIVLLMVYVKSGGSVLPAIITPESGTRTVVILHESATPSPWFGALTVGLQRKDGSAQAYLAGKGHSLYILDDDLPNKWQLSPKQVPALFILDSNGKVLLEQVIQAGTTADNVIERLRETGG